MKTTDKVRWSQLQKISSYTLVTHTLYSVISMHKIIQIYIPRTRCNLMLLSLSLTCNDLPAFSAVARPARNGRWTRCSATPLQLRRLSCYHRTHAGNPLLDYPNTFSDKPALGAFVCWLIVFFRHLHFDKPIMIGGVVMDLFLACAQNSTYCFNLRLGLGCHKTLISAGTPRQWLCHNTLTPAKTPRELQGLRCVTTYWYQQEPLGSGCVTTHWHQQQLQGLGCVTTHWHQSLGCVTTHWHQQEH